MLKYSSRSRLDKLLEQDIQLGSSMEVVTTQLNELKTVVRQLPAKPLGYARPKAIAIPMSLYENPQQLDTILTLVVSKWPTLMRQTVKVGNYIALCEEARARLDSDEETLWVASVAPGRTIRISYFGYWAEAGPGLGVEQALAVCSLSGLRAGCRVFPSAANGSIPSDGDWLCAGGRRLEGLG
ncbi:hypothetical protein LXA43DRAFT_1057237 [Ganoderma leucocontextum]|nr:hypothetical protein LXA43DRAFT_1057237 [Ganoderma leucocontextum]